MTNDEKIKAEITEIIRKAAELGWVQRMDDKAYINVADVEKILYGVLDKDYMRQIDGWVKDVVRDVKLVFNDLPILKPKDYDQLKKTVDAQAKILSRLMQGEQCIFKEGNCPYNNKDKKEP